MFILFNFLVDNNSSPAIYKIAAKIKSGKIVIVYHTEYKNKEKIGYCNFFFNKNDIRLKKYHLLSHTLNEALNGVDIKVDAPKNRGDFNDCLPYEKSLSDSG